MKTLRITSVSVSLATVFLMAFVRPSGAQETRTPVPHQQVVSANPFLILAEWFDAEYERKVGPSTTFAVSGSTIDADDGSARYVSAALILRYYPQNAALSGFYIGPRVALFNVKDDDESESVGGFGFELGYAWLLGAERRFSIDLGLGLTRLFGVDLDVDALVPTARLVNIGWAF
jgi:Protein of unknown function (DUF3575)